MPTVPSQALPPLLRLMRANRAFVSAERAREHIEDVRIRPAAYGPPRLLRRDVTISVDHGPGWPVYTVMPRHGAARGAVVYVHGGGWVNEIAVQHWRLAAQLAAEAGVSVSLPIYPLVPFGTAQEVVTAVVQLVLDSPAGAAGTSLAGDSAGGQIALSAALVLRDEHRVTVPRTVLIAPALDLTLANPEIDVVQPTDPWLGRDGARVFIEHWRGDLDVTDPRVSPLFGDLHGLGPITVFSGTRDILNPDNRLLVAGARAAGVEVEDLERDGLVHVYPLTPTREGRAARTTIVDRLRAAS
jgi:acetyl esterase/lipase